VRGLVLRACAQAASAVWHMAASRPRFRAVLTASPATASFLRAVAAHGPPAPAGAADGRAQPSRARRELRETTQRVATNALKVLGGYDPPGSASQWFERDAAGSAGRAGAAGAGKARADGKRARKSRLRRFLESVTRWEGPPRLLHGVEQGRLPLAVYKEDGGGPAFYGDKPV
jgi:hypothetical protein